MIAPLEHARLSTPAAMRLDQEVRAHLARAEERLDPCFDGDGLFPAQVEQLAFVGNLTCGYDGRLKWLKKFLARVLRPIVGRQTIFNHGVLEQLAELHAARTLECNLRDEMRDELADRMARLKGELLAELRSSPTLVGSSRQD